MLYSKMNLILLLPLLANATGDIKHKFRKNDMVIVVQDGYLTQKEDIIPWQAETWKPCKIDSTPVDGGEKYQLKQLAWDAETASWRIAKNTAGTIMLEKSEKNLFPYVAHDHKVGDKTYITDDSGKKVVATVVRCSYKVSAKRKCLKPVYHLRYKKEGQNKFEFTWHDPFAIGKDVLRIDDEHLIVNSILHNGPNYKWQPLTIKDYGFMNHRLVYAFSDGTRRPAKNLLPYVAHAFDMNDGIVVHSFPGESRWHDAIIVERGYHIEDNPKRITPFYRVQGYFPEGKRETWVPERDVRSNENMVSLTDGWMNARKQALEACEALGHFGQYCDCYIPYM